MFFYLTTAMLKSLHQLPLTVGLAAVLEFYNVQPATLAQLKTKDEDMYKSSTMKVLPGLLLIQLLMLRICRSASIAASPM